MMLIAILFQGNRSYAQQEIWKHYPAFYMVGFHSSGKINVLVSTNKILVLDSLCKKIIRSIEYSNEDFEDLSYKKMKSVYDGSIYILGKKNIYKINETTFDSIPLPNQNRYSRFLAEDDGTLWIGAYAELNIYKDGKWYPVRPEIKDPFLKIVNDYSIQDIKKDKKGNLWFSTNYGITKYNGTNYTSYSTRFGYLKGLDVFDFDFDTSGIVYVINGNYNIGLFLSIIDSSHTVHIPAIQNTRVMIDKENYVWFGPDRPGYLDNKTKVDYIETGSVSGFHLDIHGNLNYLLDNHKIVQVSNSGIRKVDFDQFGYITNGASGICIDTFGTEWIYNSQLRKLHFVFGTDSIIQFIEDSNSYWISDIDIDAENNFWISGDYQKNIIRFNPYTTDVQFYALPDDEGYRFISNDLNKIDLYSSSKIIELKDSLFSSLNIDSCNISEHFINSAVMNSHGEIYITSYDHLNLMTGFDCRRYNFPSFRKNSYVHPLKSWVMQNDEVYILMHSHDTVDYFNESILINFKDGDFNEIKFTQGDGYVSSMLLDHKNNLWIASREEVIKIEPSGNFKKYPVSDYPFLQSVSSIKLGKNNHIYFVGRPGVSELIAEDLTSTKINQSASLIFFPNPSDGRVFLRSDEKIELLEIYNTNGVLLSRFKNPGSEIEIDHDGLYYLKAHFAKNVVTQKLLVLNN
jgi:streptogramin lyase